VKKYIVPVLIFLFLFSTIMMNLFAWRSTMNPMGTSLIRIIMTLVLFAILIALIVVFIQRVHEIKEEEKDDLSQY
jgi:predicted permease